MRDPGAQARPSVVDRLFTAACSPWAVAVLVLLITAGRLALLSSSAAPPLLPEEAALWSLTRAPHGDLPHTGPVLPWLLGLLSQTCGVEAPCLRLVGPVAHGLATWGLYRLAVLLFDARTGLWCVLLYASAPLVMRDALVIGPMALLLPLWTLGLFTLVRTRALHALLDWALLGLAVGVGLMVHPVMAVFVPLALVYQLAGPNPGAAWRHAGPYVAILAAGLCLLPDLLWNASHEWRGLEAVWLSLQAGVTEFAALPGDVALLLGTGAILAGPVVGVVLVWLLARVPIEGLRGAFRDDRVRLLTLFTVPVLVITGLLALIWGRGAMLTAPALPAALLMVAGWLVVREKVVWLRAAVLVNVVLVTLMLRGPDWATQAGWVVPAALDPAAEGRGWSAAGPWLVALEDTYDGVPLGAAGADAPMLAYEAARHGVTVQIVGTGPGRTVTPAHDVRTGAGADAFSGLLVLPAVLADATGDVRARLTIDLPDGHRRSWAAVMVP